MLKEIYERSNKRKSIPFETSYMRLKTVEIEENGVLVQRSRFVEYNPIDDDKQFKPSDFELGNILAVGAYQMLKPVMMHNIDYAGSANAFDVLYSKLQQYEKVSEQNS